MNFTENPEINPQKRYSGYPVTTINKLIKSKHMSNNLQITWHVINFDFLHFYDFLTRGDVILLENVRSVVQDWTLKPSLRQRFPSAMFKDTIVIRLSFSSFTARQYVQRWPSIISSHSFIAFTWKADVVISEGGGINQVWSLTHTSRILFGCSNAELSRRWSFSSQEHTKVDNCRSFPLHQDLFLVGHCIPTNRVCKEFDWISPYVLSRAIRNALEKTDSFMIATGEEDGVNYTVYPTRPEISDQTINRGD
jgi:hypothetical protein